MFHCNPHKTGQYNPLYLLNNQGFFIAHMLSEQQKLNQQLNNELPDYKSSLHLWTSQWGGCFLEWKITCSMDTWKLKSPQKNSLGLP